MGDNALMKTKLVSILFFILIFIVIGCMGSGGSLTGGGNGSTATTSTTGGNVVPVSMVDMSFTPQVVSAHAGDTVQWTNSSALLHTVTSDNGQSGLDSSTQFPTGIPQNGVFSWTVPANASVGTNFFYHCQFHGTAGNGTALGTGMAGEITVN